MISDPKNGKAYKYFSILDMHAEGEISANRASQMLGIPRAVFCSLLAETNTPIPQKLNESIKKELKEL